MAPKIPNRGATTEGTNSGSFAPDVNTIHEDGILNLSPEDGPIMQADSPADGRANLRIKLHENEHISLVVFDEGIGRPTETNPREGNILFERTSDGIRARYSYSDTDVSTQFAMAFDEMGEEERYATQNAFRTWVREMYPNTDAIFAGNDVEFRHVSDHGVDEDGTFQTADVFHTLERDPSYVLVRDGAPLLTAYAFLEEIGYSGNSEADGLASYEAYAAAS